jgi:hypothetical protein
VKGLDRAGACRQFHPGRWSTLKHSTSCCVFILLCLPLTSYTLITFVCALPGHYTSGPSRSEARKSASSAKRAKIDVAAVATPAITAQAMAFEQFHLLRKYELHLRKCEVMGAQLSRDTADVESAAYQMQRDLDSMLMEIKMESDIVMRIWSPETDPDHTGKAWSHVNLLKERKELFLVIMAQDAAENKSNLAIRKKMLTNLMNMYSNDGTPVGGDTYSVNYGGGTPSTPSTGTMVPFFMDAHMKANKAEAESPMFNHSDKEYDGNDFNTGSL